MPAELQRVDTLATFRLPSQRATLTCTIGRSCWRWMERTKSAHHLHQNATVFGWPFGGCSAVSLSFVSKTPNVTQQLFNFWPIFDSQYPPTKSFFFRLKIHNSPDRFCIDARLAGFWRERERDILLGEQLCGCLQGERSAAHKASPTYRMRRR